jgi:hypothetical protein
VDDQNKDAKKEPTGRAKGGIAVAAKMTPEQKAERARKGALARWGAKVPTATHKGSFIEHFGTDVECYVLDDSQKTAVMSQTGFASAIGLSARGNALPRFLGSQAMTGALGAELEQKLQNPLKYQWVPGGAQPPTQLHGYDATLLIDVCKSILQADTQGKLKPQQKDVARQAAIIITASAKLGIKGLVYALAGYKPEVEEIIQAFKLYVQEEAKKYEAEFPNELYEAWLKLYDIRKPARGKPWQFMHLTRRHIYYPLAESNGKVYLLLKALKSKDGDQKTKLFQFLNEIGARALRMQIGRVLEMAESSKTPQAYEARIVERFGGQPELPGINTA